MPAKIVELLILLMAVGSQCASYCGTNWCSYGCCGDVYGQHCCGGSQGSQGIAVVALILGSVCTFVLTIVVIVLIVVCCVRCCRSPRGHQGQLVTTGQPLAVITTAGPNTTAGAYNAGYVYPPQPAPGTTYTQPAETAQPPPSYPSGPA